MKIGGIYYNVLYKPTDQLNGNVGLADFNRQEISINSDHTPQTQKIALIHEVLHILDSTYNLKLTEEQVIYTTHALISLFEDNKEIFKDFILKETL
jgi:Zn-dependent peptidase ImmA (M78 family)